MTDIMGSKGTNVTVITVNKDKTTAIMGGKEAGVTDDACVEGAHKKRDQYH